MAQKIFVVNERGLLPRSPPPPPKKNNVPFSYSLEDTWMIYLGTLEHSRILSPGIRVYEREDRSPYF